MIVLVFSHTGRKKLYLDEIPCQDSGRSEGPLHEKYAIAGAGL